MGVLNTGTRLYNKSRYANSVIFFLNVSSKNRLKKLKTAYLCDEQIVL